MAFGSDGLRLYRYVATFVFRALKKSCTSRWPALRKKIVGDPIASNSFLPPRASSDAPARAYLLIFCSVNSTCLRTRGSYFMNSSFTGFFFGLRRFT